VIAWDKYLVNLLPEGANGIVVVLENSCGQAVSYELNGNEVCKRTKDSNILGSFFTLTDPKFPTGALFGCRQFA